MLFVPWCLPCVHTKICICCLYTLSPKFCCAAIVLRRSRSFAAQQKFLLPWPARTHARTHIHTHTHTMIHNTQPKQNQQKHDTATLPIVVTMDMGQRQRTCLFPNICKDWFTREIVKWCKQLNYSPT